MTENDVKEIARGILEVYEEKTGKPRHEENTEKFDKLFGVLNWIRGAFWTFGTIFTLLATYSKLHHGT